MRRAAFLLALLALSAALAPAAVGTADARHESPHSPSTAAVTAPGDPPRQQRLSAPANTTIEIQVYGNRSTRWTVTAVYDLESDNETAAFRRYARSYRAGETDRGLTAAPFRRIVDSASSAAGRPMSVRNVNRSATVGNGTGTVSLSFVWTAMLERTGNRTIRLDDALLLPSNRTWLGTLEPNQTLVVRTPEGYSIVDSEAPSFNLRNNSVIISGPARVRGNLDITYRRATVPGSDVSGDLIAGAVLLGAVLVALALYLRRRDAADAAPAEPAPDDPVPGAGRDAPANDAAPADDETLDGSDEGDGADADAADEDGAPVDPALLSDEERVEHLLRDNGGRMKQATIVSETGWSDAKVSQLLSSMADEGRVDKLRLGRENLISLADEDMDVGDGAGDDDTV